MPLKNILHQIPTLVFVTITVYSVCLPIYLCRLSKFSHILNYFPQNALLIAHKLPINFWNAFPHLLFWSNIIFQKVLGNRLLKVLLAAQLLQLIFKSGQAFNFVRNTMARSLVVSDLRLETKGSWFECSC